ncbi:MAG: hypothetical protein KAS32_26110 [Candidatus Peribacteraceae bacterium]|nr:hypothetical protein [Candidatus Peribacteraceae bacterium]
MRMLFLLAALAMMFRAHWDNPLDWIFSTVLAGGCLVLAFIIHREEVNRPKNLGEWCDLKN